MMKLFSFLRKQKAPLRRGPVLLSQEEEDTATRYLAGGLSVAKVRELFEVIQMREVFPRLPDNFAEGRVAHLLFSGTSLTRAFKDRGATSVLVGFIGRREARRGSDVAELRFQTGTDRLPLKEWCCRWALLSAPSTPAARVVPLIKELGRIVEPGGGGVVVDWHPYSSAVQQTLSSRPVVNEVEGIGLEKYFRAFQQAGMMATQVKEAFVDANIRKLMETSEEKKWYQQHRRQPFALVIFAKKT